MSLTAPPDFHRQQAGMLLFSRGHKTGLRTTGWAWFFIQTTKTKHLFFFTFFFTMSPKKKLLQLSLNYNYLEFSLHWFVFRKCAISTSLQKIYLISVSLWFGHVKNMRACIVVELPMLCTGFCLSSVLVHSVCDAWWWEKRDGMALWSVGVGFLCGNSWSTTHILYSLCFCIFFRSCNIRNS